MFSCVVAVVSFVNRANRTILGKHPRYRCFNQVVVTVVTVRDVIAIVKGIVNVNMQLILGV